MDDLRLYKFGKRAYMCKLIHDGQLYLSPASKFGESGLSKGAHDPCELILEQTLPGSAGER